MALLKYNPTNVVGGVSYKTPIIRFSRKGASMISKSAVELMELKGGDRISLMRDEEESEGDWSIIKDPEGFELRAQKDVGSLVFNSAAMANMIIDGLKKDNPSMSFKISLEPFEVEGEEEKAWTIIMASGK